MNPVVPGPRSPSAKKQSPAIAEQQPAVWGLSTPFHVHSYPTGPKTFPVYWIRRRIPSLDIFRVKLTPSEKKRKKKKKRMARAAVSFSCAVKLALPSTVTVALYLFYFIYLFFLHISPPAEPLIYLKQNGLSCRCDTLHNTISLVGGGRRAKRCNKKNTRPPVGIGTPGNNSITEGCLGKTKTRQSCLPDKSNVLRFFFF